MPRVRHGSSNGVFVVALVLVGVTSAACELAFQELRAEERDTWSQSYALGPEGRVEVRNTNGPIEVGTSPDGRVHVRADKLAKAMSAEAAKELLGKTTIRETVTSDSVRLETETPGGHFLHGQVNVHYQIEMPAGASVKVVNTNGRVTVSNLSGAVDAETTNGGVEGAALSGPVHASTTNGAIDVAVAAVHERGITLETTNGGVTLAVPNGARADLSLETTHGGIDTASLKVQTSESSSHHFEGRLNGGGPRVRIETTNGGVQVRGH